MAPYNSGYSLAAPLPMNSPSVFTIDSTNGMIHYNESNGTSASDLFLITIKATEYRNDTVWSGGSPTVVPTVIGYVLRNMLFSITASGSCPDDDLALSNPANPGTQSNGFNLYCNNGDFDVAFTENVQCSSVDSLGSFIHMVDSATGDTVEISRADALDCTSRDVTNKVNIITTNSLSNGIYYLTFKTGVDSNTVISECGMEMTPFADTLKIVVEGDTNGIMTSVSAGQSSDSVVTYECGQPTFDVYFTEKVKCGSMDKYGSEFVLIKRGTMDTISITNVIRYCSQGYFKHAKTYSR